MEHIGINVHNGDCEKPEGYVRFVCLSDTHSRTNGLNVPLGDVLLHTGDFTGRGDGIEVQKFNRFLENLPHPVKIVIAGNHDMSFDRSYYLKRNKDPDQIRALLTACVYLEDSGTDVFGYTVWGSPWTPTF